MAVPFFPPDSACQLSNLIILVPRASVAAQLVKNSPTMQETWVRSLGWEDPWKREQPPTLIFWPGEFHGLYSGKEWGGMGWQRIGHN